MFKVKFKKADFGIQVLTYLDPLDTSAFASQTGYSPCTDRANILHYEMMMLIF